MPQCADSGGTFCENFSSYPYHHVKDVLERNRVQSNFFGEDEIPENININNRVGVSDDFICDSLERTVFPRIGKNRNNQWKFIVNQDKNEGSYIQGVRTETCLRLIAIVNVSLITMTCKIRIFSVWIYRAKCLVNYPVVTQQAVSRNICIEG